MSKPLVIIVTAAWNQTAITLQCLESAFELEYPNFKFILVDNGSHEPLAAQVTKQFPQVALIKLEENVGFARGFNQAISAALAQNADYIYVVNNDIVFDPASLTHLVKKAEDNKSAGLIASKVYFLDDPRKIWHMGGQMSDLFLEITETASHQNDQGQFDDWDQIRFAPLCSTLIPASVFRKIGLLDEKFFVYYEDMDFCYRLHQAGYSLHVEPKSKIWHAVSSSSGGSHSPRERYWSAQGSGRYFRKHAGLAQLIFFIVPFRLGSAIKTSFKLARDRKFVALKAYWLGLWRGWRTAESLIQPPDWVANG